MAEEKKTEEVEEVEEHHGNGNLRLPFGLCERYGIALPKGATPRDAWNALEGIGISPDDVWDSFAHNHNDVTSSIDELDRRRKSKKTETAKEPEQVEEKQSEVNYKTPLNPKKLSIAYNNLASTLKGYIDEATTFSPTTSAEYDKGHYNVFDEWSSRFFDREIKVKKEIKDGKPHFILKEGKKTLLDTYNKEQLANNIATFYTKEAKAYEKNTGKTTYAFKEQEDKRNAREQQRKVKAKQRQQNFIDEVKTRLNIDLSKATYNELGENAHGFEIDTRKLKPNEMNSFKYYAIHKQAIPNYKIDMFDSGAHAMFILVRKK